MAEDFDLTAELDAMAEARMAEFVRRRQQQLEERAEKKRRRDAGLKARHAAKLARKAA